MTYRGADPTAVMGRRIAAYVLDAVIATVIIGAFGYSLYGPAMREVPSGTINCPTDAESTQTGRFRCTDNGRTVRYLPLESEQEIRANLSLLGIGLSLVLSVGLQGLTGATPGKFALGLRVVDAKGAPPGLGRALVRTVLLIVDSFCCAVIGLLTSFKSVGHKRVGDMVAGTMVIGRRDRDALILARSGIALPDRKTMAAVAYTAPVEPDWASTPGPTEPASGPATWQGANAPMPGPTGAADQTSSWPATSSTPVVATATASQPGVDAPMWDDARATFIQYDRELSAWMQWDEPAQQWRPIDG